MPRHWTFIAALLSLSIPLTGCEQPKHHVSGKVTFKNEPVPAGHIFFDPDATKSNDGPQGFATIKDGRYDTAAEGGKGVIGGPYVVRIRAYDGKAAEELPLGRPLFGHFTESIELPKSQSTKDFDVPENAGIVLP